MPETVKRTAEGNFVPLRSCESMFDQATAEAIVDGCIPPGMAAEASGKTTSDRIRLLKQATIISYSSTLAIEREISRLAKDYVELEILAEHRLQRIEMYGASLANERSKKIHALKKLNEAKGKLDEAATQKVINDQRCLEAT